MLINNLKKDTFGLQPNLTWSNLQNWPDEQKLKSGDGSNSTIDSKVYVLIVVMFVLCQPGRLKGVQAIGWYLEEANMAQVSINISDHEETPIHTVYEEVCNEAKVNQICSFCLP